MFVDDTAKNPTIMSSYYKSFQIQKVQEENKQEQQQIQQDKKQQQQQIKEQKQQIEQLIDNKNPNVLGVELWFEYLTGLENDIYEQLGLRKEIKKYKQKSKAFVSVDQLNGNGEINYIKQLYEFLEILYKQYVKNLLKTIHTLYWEGVDDSILLNIAYLVRNSEYAKANKFVPTNGNDYRQFLNEYKRSNLSLSESISLAIKMNASYLTEIRNYSEEQFPSDFDVTNLIPKVKI